MFTPDLLGDRLRALGATGDLWVAFSGGMDSTVLLAALVELHGGGALTGGLRALHVHHGLDPAADAWSDHCRSVCDRAGVPLQVLSVRVDPAAGSGPEDAARRARYAAFSAALPEGAVLLTAQHRDDQAETLLLRLLRGAGVDGLAAMRGERPLGQARLLRPLLDWTRAELRAWAEQRELAWVDDPSNRDIAPDRNYLRHEILPRLQARWPGCGTSLARSVRLCAEAADGLVAVAGERLAGNPAGPDCLAIDWLLSQPPALRPSLLREWVRGRGLPLPGAEALRRILDEVTGAGADRAPRVEWAGVQLRRYRGRLFVERPLPEPDADVAFTWTGAERQDLTAGITLLAHPVSGTGVARRHLDGGRVTVRFRTGGERCRPCGRGGSHPLKKIFQELGVPPWHRGRVPLVCVDGAIAAAAGLFDCADFAATEGEPGVRFEVETTS